MDLIDFFKYLVKDAFGEVVDFLKDIVSLRPKTMVYLTGTMFVVAWLLGYKTISALLVIVFTGFLFHKYYVAGDWRRQAKEEKIKKAQEMNKEQVSMEK